MHRRVRVRCPRFLLACVLLAVTSPESIIADDDGDSDAAIVNVEIIDDDYAVLYGNYDDDDDDDDDDGRPFFPCEYAGGDIALRLHHEDPSTVHAARSPRYEWLRLPLSLTQNDKYSWRAKEEDDDSILAMLVGDVLPQFRTVCETVASGGAFAEASTSSSLGASWGAHRCAEDLGRQFEQRVALICAKHAPPSPLPPYIPSSSFRFVSSVKEEAHVEIALGASVWDSTLTGAMLSPTQMRKRNSTASAAAPNMALATECLRLTTPGLALEYPHDAEEHFEELQRTLAPWNHWQQQQEMRRNSRNGNSSSRRSNDGGHYARPYPFRYHGDSTYAGPWIENLWIKYFTPPWRLSSQHQKGRRSRSRRKLRDIFGPFIPIFLPFTDLWEPNGKRALPPDLMPALLRVLRPTVPYITVLQHDLGLCLAAPCDFSLEDCDGGEGGGSVRTSSRRLPANVLVLSSGGFGHVPIPLLKQPEAVLGETGRNGKKAADHRYFASFVGKIENGPVRRELLSIILAEQQKQLEKDDERRERKDLINRRRLHYHYGPDWRSVVSASTYSLCPRGHGRAVRAINECSFSDCCPARLMTCLIACAFPLP